MRKTWISTIFEMLRRRYDAQWTAKAGGDDKIEARKIMDSWAEVLHDITPEEIRRGFELIDLQAPEHPPNVMQFKRMCRPIEDKMSLAHRDYFRDSAVAHYKCLPKPKADKQKAMAEIENIRGKIR
jgi:hypothetical protein